MSFGSTLIVIVAIIAFTVMRIVRHRASIADGRYPVPRDPRRGELPSPREEQLAREVEDLRDRIAVLERIATEDRHGRAVAAEIESLREK